LEKETESEVEFDLVVAIDEAEEINF